MALPRRQWNTDIDFELISHISTTLDSSDVALLSDCLTKMAEHVWALPGDEQHIMLAGLLAKPSTMQELCSATSSVLQQLSEGVQQYLQQGQLPTALTANAVEGCNALCLTLSNILDYSAKAPVNERHRFAAVLCSTGACTGNKCCWLWLPQHKKIGMLNKPSCHV
jgi:hypothetical protein